MTQSDTARPALDLQLFGEGPARDARFTVCEVWAELENFPDGTPERDHEFLHRQMNEEMCVMENAARSLAEFPDADWSVRKGLARQCADEARHTMNYHRLLVARGGKLGEHPIMNFQYRILGKIDNLVGLKENVILGHLIPAGTGFHNHQSSEVRIRPEAQQELRDEHARVLALFVARYEEVRS